MFQVEKLDFNKFSHSREMSSELFDLPDVKDPTGTGEADFEELNLPEVSKTVQKETVGEPAVPDYSTDDDLFTTYKKFLRDSPDNMSKSGAALFVEETPQDPYVNTRRSHVNTAPLKKRRKNSRISEGPRNIEKNVTLMLRVAIKEDDCERFANFISNDENFNNFLEAQDGTGIYLVKDVPSFEHFHKIRAGDRLLSFNESPAANEDLNSLKTKIQSSSKAFVFSFTCSRNLKLAKMSHLKGDLIDPEKLNEIVEELGGYDMINEKKQWQSVRERLGLQFTTSSSHQLKTSYINYFQGVLI